MTGDIDDCYNRLVSALPSGWFVGPLTSAFLYGFAVVLSACYQVLAYINLQARIATAIDGNLDMIAGDFLGLGLPRNSNESDASYRARILTAMFRERATRRAVIQILTQLTGNTPTVIEPWIPGDCGGYGLPVMGYGVAGRWGSLTSPASAFVVAYRPRSVGVLNVPGYGNSQNGYGLPHGCYVPAGSLLNLTDQNIFAAVEGVKAEGVTLWVKLQDAA